MPNYEHHIFISYRRCDEDWVRWTRENFVRALRSLLGPQIDKISIYIDESIEKGASWPAHLASHLSRSRLMVPVLSRGYFESDWCRLELALMLERERMLNFRTPLNPAGLIIPVVIDDGDCFPPEVKAIQAQPFHEFANPFVRVDSPKQEALAEALRRGVCPAIDQALRTVPTFNPKWEQIAHKQFENRFRIQARTQTTLPPLTLPQLP